MHLDLLRAVNVSEIKSAEKLACSYSDLFFLLKNPRNNSYKKLKGSADLLAVQSKVFYCMSATPVAN